MLKTLSIKNYTLITALTLTLNRGFSVITGETGAGKSILLGALSLILGRRADLAVLKDDSKKCVIEGEFDVSSLNLKPFFEQHDLDYDVNTFLRREILPSGKSRAFVNDTPVNLSVLKQLGEMLVDIHSQHQTLMLSDSGFQMEVLDNYLSNTQNVAAYKMLFRRYSLLKKELKALKEKEEALKKEEDFLKFQFEELDSVTLDEDVFRNMEERQQFLMHSEEVISALNMAGGVLTESDRNVTDRLVLVRDSLSNIAGYFPKADALIERLESARLELKDISDEIFGLKSEGDVNPAELNELTDKLDEVYRLQQKHRVQTVNELKAVKDELSDKLLGITGVENEIVKVTGALKEATEQLEKSAGRISSVRSGGISRFENAVQEVLKKLGMKEAVFKVVLHPLSDFSETGKEQVDFWFSANKGVPPGNISKIASGGELSRLMLAVKSLITEKSLLPTVVFDEIDSGVSGEIAGKAGNIMKEMATHHQLIVISHLPQIASKADFHYKVFKEATANSTQTNIVMLTDEGRVDEIAAMLSDEKVTTIARQAAKELLN
jgi:DNA repair protein RecN (Recombination protein N)